MWCHWPQPSICTPVIETYSSTLCALCKRLAFLCMTSSPWGVSAGGTPIDHSQNWFSAISLLASPVYAAHSFSRATKHFFSPSCFLMASHTRQTGLKRPLSYLQFCMFWNCVVKSILYLTKLWSTYKQHTNSCELCFVDPVLDKHSSVKVSSRVCNRLKIW